MMRHRRGSMLRLPPPLAAVSLFVICLGLVAFSAGRDGAPAQARVMAQIQSIVINAERSLTLTDGQPAPGGDPGLEVGVWNGTERIAYLGFVLPPSLDSDARILGAELRLYCTAAEIDADPNLVFQLSPVLEAWGPGTDYDHRPASGEPRADWTIGSCEDGQRWRSVSGPELVDAVQRWLDGSLGNHGWELRQEDRDRTARYAFQGAEPGPLANAPRLHVEFEPGSPPSPSATATGARTPSPMPTGPVGPSPSPSTISSPAPLPVLLPWLAPGR